jgi:hypothetical protein
LSRSLISVLPTNSCCASVSVDHYDVFYRSVYPDSVAVTSPGKDALSAGELDTLCNIACSGDSSQVFVPDKQKGFHENILRITRNPIPKEIPIQIAPIRVNSRYRNHLSLSSKPLSLHRIHISLSSLIEQDSPNRGGQRS